MLLFIADLPPMEQERIVCSIAAAVKYEIPANIVLAIAEKEGGKPGQWVRNTNGTHDVGPMQFNTAYLGDLARYGITADDVAAAGCYSYDLAAWRLRGHIVNDSGDIWTRAANYHSRTPRFNSIYRADLIQKAGKWAYWLDEHFVTRDVLKEGGQPAATAQRPTQPVAAEASSELAAPTQGVTLTGYVPRRILFRAEGEGSGK